MAAETSAQLNCLAIESGRDLKEFGGGNESGSVVDFGFCAICLEKIVLQETALVKGCEHAYCVTCILRWASYKENPVCPQCKHPFETLSVHRSLDGCIHDYMFDESVCLLLRATWFIPLTIEPHEEAHDDTDDLYPYYYAEELEEDEEDLESYYVRGNSSTILRIGNRRWGDTGYVRAGRKEARPVRQHLYIDDDCDVGPPRLYSSSSSSSSSNKKKDKEKMEGEGSSSKEFTGSNSSRKKNKEKKEGEGSVSKELIGRRAKRAMKREAADRVAAAKHQQHLQRFGLVDAIDDRTVISQE